MQVKKHQDIRLEVDMSGLDGGSIVQLISVLKDLKNVANAGEITYIGPKMYVKIKGNVREWKS